MKLIVDQQELNFPDRWSMADEEFFDFASQINENRIESDKHGNIFIMPPVANETGGIELNTAYYVKLWFNKNGGEIFGSITGFTLPKGAGRSPDVSWISTIKYNAIGRGELKGYARVCPEFVMEIRSESDRIKALM